MKRLLVVFTVLVGTLALGSISAASDHHELPEHPHLLIQRPVIELVDFGDGPVPAVTGVRKCVDLAANNKLPLGSQHHNVHFGTAGMMLSEKAGHVVAPAAPFPEVPWANCEEFLGFFPFPIPQD